MTKEETRFIHESFGAIEVELRQGRAVQREILKQLKALVKLYEGDNAKLQAVREDVSTLTEANRGLQRDVAAHTRQLAAVSGGRPTGRIGAEQSRPR